MIRHRPGLVAQVREELRHLIVTELEPGAKLPSEQQLATDFGVSRNTLREAVLSLWNEGMIVRRWGVGTFVRDNQEPVSISLTDVTPGMRESIEASGHEASLAYVDVAIMPAPDHVVASLGLEPGDDAVFIDRTFAIDGVPAVVLQDWVPREVNDRPVDATALKDVQHGLLLLLRDDHGCEIVRLEAELSALVADEALAARLDIPVGAPLIASRQVGSDNRGDNIVCGDIWYRTDTVGLRLIRATRF